MCCFCSTYHLHPPLTQLRGCRCHSSRLLLVHWVINSSQPNMAMSTYAPLNSLKSTKSSKFHHSKLDTVYSKTGLREESTNGSMKCPKESVAWNAEISFEIFIHQMPLNRYKFERKNNNNNKAGTFLGFRLKFQPTNACYQH